MPKSNNADTKTLEILTHVLAIFTHFVGPLVILLASTNREVKAHAKNALNWQISATIYFIVSFILVFVLIGIPLLLALIVLNIVFCLIAAVRASEGKLWRYPLSISFLK